ncbi:MAG: hypothetical protein HOV68_02495 [Streptomycetaceae bacterium]|nr:hypothetical protein [Streptomycetaceae bacterium]
MPTPDDHVQDPALARALRDLDLPGPVVPAYAPAEVRRRGARRRTRRRALWAGSGLVAAVLMGALVWGPLTPERSGRGPTAAAQPKEAGTAVPQQSAAAPGQSAVPSPEVRSSADAHPVVATLDIGGQKLTMRPEAGDMAGTWMDTYAAGPAADVLTDTPQTLVVTALHPTYDLKGYGPQLGDEYAVRVPWVVSLRTQNGVDVFVAAPELCRAAYCPSQENAVGLIGLFGEEWAKKFYDAVEVGDKVEVVGEWTAGETSVTPKSTATTKATGAGKVTPSASASRSPTTAASGSRAPNTSAPSAG